MQSRGLILTETALDKGKGVRFERLLLAAPGKT